LKLDFEKAYDKVNWDFLLNCFTVRGFNPLFCSWVKKVLHNGTVSVKINNEVGKYFQSAKGVRQGDPLSPFFFNMAGEVLTKMVLSAQRNGLFSGLASNLVENGIAILQYADDTVLCIEHDQEKAVNLKLLLYIFEMMSGLKINFLKSELFIIGEDNNIASFYSDLFNCQVGSLPMKYLGVPVTFLNLKNVDWDFLDAKLLKKLDNWVCGSATSGGRLTLLDAYLSGIPYYYMSMFLLSLTFIEKLNKHRRRFFWAGKKRKKKYHLVKWSRICRSKKKGGLGVKDLRKQNISLLCKWWWKLETQSGMWQKIVKAKYLRNKTVANVKARMPDSPCWKALLKVKEFYLKGRKVILNRGNIVRFWLDPWLNNTPLCESYPSLFDVCHAQEWTFEKVLSCNLVIPFRRRLCQVLQEHWDYIKNAAINYDRPLVSDGILWMLNANGRLPTKSLYCLLEKDVVGSNNKWIWEAKLPLKIKFFLWQLFQNAILTRDNLKKRNWPGSPICSFCNEHESLKHLFFGCSHAKVIWGVVGSVLNAHNMVACLLPSWGKVSYACVGCDLLGGLEYKKSDDL
jgi:hypothetical protein